MKYFILSLGIALPMLLLSSCGSVEQLALKSASGYLNCPEDEMEAKWVDVRTYRVSGCAGSGVFVCSKLKKKCKYDSQLN